MRVIAGSARRLLLKSLKGNKTRPTLDRYKETLFNTIQGYVPDSRFLDLFAGTGSIGIEALSRGASHCTFVENDREAVKVINENLKITHLEDKADVMTSDVLGGLLMIEKQGPFDVIFMDPPYDMGLELAVMRYLSSSKLADNETLIIIEASNETDTEELCGGDFEIIRTKDYKTNRHILLKRAKK
ncbi:MAG: 16S rRNA (guanine(966)-N(2))-methyltransferase RsmD [Lachnospiraceae bacterium]|nr:16S rRNA (guanine(966)-N(2))-methyltransferase RsmD [Lachnospiraceae bacterium]